MKVFGQLAKNNKGRTTGSYLLEYDETTNVVNGWVSAVVFDDSEYRELYKDSHFELNLNNWETFKNGADEADIRDTMLKNLDLWIYKSGEVDKFDIVKFAEFMERSIKFAWLNKNMIVMVNTLKSLDADTVLNWVD